MEPIEHTEGDVVLSTESVGTWLKDTFERALSTAVQSFLTFIVVANGIDMSAKNAAFAAAIAAGLNVVKQAMLAVSLPIFPNRWADLAARAGWTGLLTGVTLLAVDGFNWASMTAWQGVGIAAATAVLAIVKGFLADKVSGDPGDPTVTPASFVKPSAGQVVAHPAQAA